PCALPIAATFGDFTITSAGHYDVCVVRYSPEGDVLWAWSAGGPHPDRAYGLAQDADGSTYVAGRFKELATFGDTTLVSAGHHDVFLVKYKIGRASCRERACCAGDAGAT